MEGGDFKEERDLVDGRQKPEWRQKAAAFLTTTYQASHELDIKVIGIKRYT